MPRGPALLRGCPCASPLLLPPCRALALPLPLPRALAAAGRGRGAGLGSGGGGGGFRPSRVVVVAKTTRYEFEQQRYRFAGLSEDDLRQLVSAARPGPAGVRQPQLWARLQREGQWGRCPHVRSGCCCAAHSALAAGVWVRCS